MFRPRGEGWRPRQASNLGLTVSTTQVALKLSELDATPSLRPGVLSTVLSSLPVVLFTVSESLPGFPGVLVQGMCGERNLAAGLQVGQFTAKMWHSGHA